MKKVEFGVFLPIGNNGYLISTNAPQYYPSFELNKNISLLAEDLGFDYVFSMSKWRGFGGLTQFWDYTLDSVTLMTALAAVTQRIRLIATVSPPLAHPAVAAKVIATLDEISGGRIGINIVTGASLAEFDQMGILPEGYDVRRYEYASQWIQIVKRLWAGERVTDETGFFRLVDCVSSPRPVQRPHPFIVCAGTSDAGAHFTALEADYAFIVGKSAQEIRDLGGKMKSVASEHGRAVKTATPAMIILGESDEVARDEHQRYRDGVDAVAIENLVSTYLPSNRASTLARVERTKNLATFSIPVIKGGPHTVAEQIEALTEDDGLDGLLLVFPDYLKGLISFHREVKPILNTSELSAFDAHDLNVGSSPTSDVIRRSLPNDALNREDWENYVGG